VLAVGCVQVCAITVFLAAPGHGLLGFLSPQHRRRRCGKLSHDVPISGAPQETADKRYGVFVPQAYARHHYGRSAWRDHTLQANPIVPSSGDANNSTVAERQHREYSAPRIAIVDIDIHHGTHTAAFILPHEYL
jgi:hypothetical protein